MRPTKTNWNIITGGPSSGKTKTLEYLAFLGYKIIPERARIFIDNEMSKGKTIEQIKSNNFKFQKKVLKIKLETEERLNPEQLLFLERGIADSIAYYKMSGGDPKQIYSLSKKRKYKNIFIMAPLPFQEDYARTENQKTAKNLHNLLLQTYKNLGYKTILVPVMPISERANYILKRIEQS